MKTTKTFAELTTSDYLVHLDAGDINGSTGNMYDFSNPYPKITSVEPYSDGVNSFIRINFYDSQWYTNTVSTRLLTESVVVSDVQVDPSVPTVTDVTTVITYSDGSTETYIGAKQ